jgi:hypothetical protein
MPTTTVPPPIPLDCAAAGREWAHRLGENQFVTVSDQRHTRECSAQIANAVVGYYQQRCEAEWAPSESSNLAYNRERLRYYEQKQAAYPGEREQMVSFYRGLIARSEEQTAAAKKRVAQTCTGLARANAGLFSVGGSPATVARSGPPPAAPSSPPGGYNEQGCPKGEWVNGYTRKDGTRVQGYWRNSGRDGCGGG